MSGSGSYLYGFTNRHFQPSDDLCGLGGAPVRVAVLGNVAAVISSHPVQRLLPSRSNLEPHHRVVRQVSSSATMIPAAFGHISESETQIVDVLLLNHDRIVAEIARLDQKSEMGIKLSWTVPDIYQHLVKTDPELEELRDRVFQTTDPSVADKLQVGSKFEALLLRERERLSQVLLGAFDGVAREVSWLPPRTDHTICQAAMLIERGAQLEFQTAVWRAAALFDRHYTLEYSGPWPLYSFVQLRLQLSTTTSVA